MASFARKQLISAAVNEAGNVTPSWLNEEEEKGSPTPKPSHQPPAPRNPPPPPPPPAKASTTSNPAFDPEVGKNPEPPSTTPAPSTPSNASSEFIIEKETLDEIRKHHLALRLAYMASTVFMAVVLCLQNQPDPGQVFIAGYVFFFAVLICCFEFALNSIARLIAANFGFLYSLTGRLTFLLFVGFMCFSLGTWGIIAMCVLYLVGIFHFYIMYKFPRFEEYLRKKHYYEGRNANK